MGYSTVDVADLEAEGPGGTVRKVRRAVGGRAFGFNYFTLPPGIEGREHDHAGDGQEEVYFVVTGTGRMRIDDDEIRPQREDALDVRVEQRTDARDALDLRRKVVEVAHAGEPVADADREEHFRDRRDQRNDSSRRCGPGLLAPAHRLRARADGRRNEAANEDQATEECAACDHDHGYFTRLIRAPSKWHRSPFQAGLVRPNPLRAYTSPRGQRDPRTGRPCQTESARR